MTDTAVLTIKVDSSGADRATRNLNKLDKAAGNTERAANKMGKAFGKAIGGLLTGYAIQRATGYYIQQADAFANMSAKLKLVTGSTQAATKAQRDLFNLSQATSSDLEATTDLYVKLGQSNKDLAADSELLLGITEKVSKALVISGADAASSTAVIRQFSQAMGAGALRGDEFISVMEGAPRLAQAIADGLQVPIGALRDMAAEGELTADKVIKALEDQGAKIDEEFGQMPLTVGRATQQVRNALTQLIGDTEKTSGATHDLATAIADLARTLESEETKRGFASVISGIVGIASASADAIGWLSKLNDKILQSLNLSEQQGQTRKAAPGDLITGLSGGWKALLQGDFAGAQAGGNLAQQGLNAALNGRGGQVANFSNVVGASDGVFDNVVGGSDTFDPNKKSAVTATGIKEKTKAVKELTEAEKQWIEFEKDVLALQEESDESSREYALNQIKAAQDKQDAIREGQAATDELIAGMEFELSLLGLSNKEREKAIALRYADAHATDEQKAKIADLAEAYVKAADAMEFQIDVLDGARSATRGFFDDLREGVGIWDSLTNAAGRFADRLYEVATDQLVNQFFGKSGTNGAGTTGGGWLGALFGGASGGGGGEAAGSIVDLFSGSGFGFAGGGFTGVGGRNQVAGLAHKGEVVWSQDDIARSGGVGRVESMRRGGGGGTTNITVNVPRSYTYQTAAQVAQETGAVIQRTRRNM